MKKNLTHFRNLGFLCTNKKKKYTKYYLTLITGRQLHVSKTSHQQISKLFRSRGSQGVQITSNVQLTRSYPNCRRAVWTLIRAHTFGLKRESKKITKNVTKLILYPGSESMTRIGRKMFINALSHNFQKLKKLFRILGLGSGSGIQDLDQSQNITDCSSLPYPIPPKIINIYLS